MWVKKFYPLSFSEICFQTAKSIFKQNFTLLLYVHIYAKLQNFIQLPLNLTKLCLIKRSHPVRCHFYNVSSMNFYRFTINNGLKHTIYYSLWNSKQSSVKMFLYKVDIVCSKCPPPAEAHASLISVCWSLSPASHPRSAAVHFLASETF